MTYKEQLARDHPEYSSRKVEDYCMKWCPPDISRGDCEPNYCRGEDASLCSACWDREIPEEAKEEIVVTNTDFDHPCRNCNVGWGSASSNGCKTCHDTCDRLAAYNQRLTKETTEMNNEKTCAPNYEALYREERAKNKELSERISQLEDNNRILLAKIHKFQGAIAMAEAIFGGKWKPNTVEVSRGV